MREAGIPGIRYLDAGSRGAADVNELRGTVSMWEVAARKSPNDPYARQALDQAKASLAEAEKALSRNFVVFNENLIEIVRKYGIAGAAAMLGVSASELQAQADQQPGLMSAGVGGGGRPPSLYSLPDEADGWAAVREYLRSVGALE